MSDLVLVDDPIANDLFDLRGLLATGDSGHLAAIAMATPAAAGATSEAVEAGARTAGADIVSVRYRVLSPGSKGVRENSELEGTPEEAVGFFLERPGLPFAVIVFVSPATLPLVEALHTDERTRPLFKLGVTGPRFDNPYNLARKLIRDGKIHYHEHTLTLPVVLHKRFATMLRAHATAARGV